MIRSKQKNLKRVCINLKTLKMKLISLEKFRSENESSILNLKKASEISGGDPPGGNSQYTEKESTDNGGAETDCVNIVYNDAGGKILDYPVF